jgi:CIC family chloride channel protein
MNTNVVTATLDDDVAAAERKMLDNGVRGLPVAIDGRLAGMFTMSDAFLAERTGKALVGDAMTSGDLVVAYADESLHSALQRMAGRGISRLPVVSRDDRGKLIGILTVRDMAAAVDAASKRTITPVRRPRKPFTERWPGRPGALFHRRGKSAGRERAGGEA